MWNVIEKKNPAYFMMYTLSKFSSGILIEPTYGMIAMEGK